MRLLAGLHLAGTQHASASALAGWLGQCRAQGIDAFVLRAPHLDGGLWSTALRSALALQPHLPSMLTLVADLHDHAGADDTGEAALPSPAQDVATLNRQLDALLDAHGVAQVTQVVLPAAVRLPVLHAACAHWLACGAAHSFVLPVRHPADVARATRLPGVTHVTFNWSIASAPARLAALLDACEAAGLQARVRCGSPRRSPFARAAQRELPMLRLWRQLAAHYQVPCNVLLYAWILQHAEGPQLHLVTGGHAACVDAGRASRLRLHPRHWQRALVMACSDPQQALPS